ncbi:hypothetical protein PHMEG_00030679 [Phytophthora megakarya]|uniref:ZSWIM1/3 RNaseH-like domain-containing protein n=1 Tax=Phytophthora megakarya TaxID=4795 RepID=A0A225V1A7_9STRA|nr:hypothetical protein PHMEG_00030679 [Phytophthora megakarya]
MLNCFLKILAWPCACTYAHTGESQGSHVRKALALDIQWQNTQTGWKLRVMSGGRYTHNHEVSTDVYSTYPCSHGVSDPIVEARVERMLDGGTKRSKIFQYLLEHDQNVIMSDVDNMVSARKSAVTTLNDHGATTAELARLNAANVENISTVTENESGTVGVISLAKAHMGKMFSRFSQVLLVDSSHKANRHDYQLLTFMVMNQFGKGTVLEAIDHFKRANPDGLELLRVIIVDKDLNEIRVLQNEFPEARGLICLFHTIKWLKEKRSKPDYGKVSSEDAELIDAAIHAMIYAQTREVYDKNHASLQDICVRVRMEQFFEHLHSEIKYRARIHLTRSLDWKLSVITIFQCCIEKPPPIWLSDSCIRALCERLISKYPSARFGGIQSAQQQANGHATGSLKKSIQMFWPRLMNLLLPPVQFQGRSLVRADHQCLGKNYFVLRFLDADIVFPPVKDIANRIKRQALRNFEVVALNHPC